MYSVFPRLVGKNVVLLDKVSKVSLLGLIERLIVTTDIHLILVRDKDSVPTLVLLSVELTDRVLEGLIEGGTYVVTDVLKHVNRTGSTVSYVVLKLVVVVLVKDIGRVGGLIVEECGALLKLLSLNRDSTCTANVVDLSEVSVGCVISVKRNGNNAESGGILHRLVNLILERTYENDTAEENLVISESVSDRLLVSVTVNKNVSGSADCKNALLVEEELDLVNKVVELFILA